MAFRFNFAPGAVSSRSEQDCSQQEREQAHPSESNLRSAQTPPVQEVSWDPREQLFDLGSVQLTPDLAVRKGNVTGAEASCLLREGEVTASDLLPGRYEGGFKLWECAIDLARYLLDRAGAQPVHGKLASQRVIELGCGHGIPGIVALLAGAAVDFQDYNQEVLSRLTCPNIAANCTPFPMPEAAGPSAAPKGTATRPPRPTAPAMQSGTGHELQHGGAAPCSRFFAGDWAALPSFLEAEQLAGTYDLVLSAETIYSHDSLRALHDCILACLKRPHGQALIAAKVHYFGIGGGVAAFTDLVSRLGKFSVQKVAEYDDGFSNCRQILRLTYANI